MTRLQRLWTLVVDGVSAALGLPTLLGHHRRLRGPSTSSFAHFLEVLGAKAQRLVA